MLSPNSIRKTETDSGLKATEATANHLQHRSFVPPTFLAGLVLLIRFFLIGQPPFTDEGNYIAMSYHLWTHPFEVVPSLCPLSSINLYSVALSWLFHFFADGFIAFRAVDAIVTALCTVVLHALLRELSQNRGIAFFLTLLWVLCVNHPVFINAGFKNPYAPGFTCIFYALLLLVRNVPALPAFRVGALLGAAFLFREPLIVYAVPVGFYLLKSHSLKFSVRMTGGAVLTIIAGFLALGLSRGGNVLANTRNIVSSWTEISVMHETLLIMGHYDRTGHALSQFQTTMNIIGWTTPVWIIGTGGSIFRFLQPGSNKPLLLLLGLLTVSPLPEFILKLGFPYHLSACVAGLAMLSAVGLRAAFLRHGTTLRWLCPLALGASVLWFPAKQGQLSSAAWVTGYRDACRISTLFLPVMMSNITLPEKTGASFFLKASASIQRFSKPGERILISGFYGGLYPLSNRQPPQLEITDLTTYSFSRRLLLSEQDRIALNQRLPTLFIETNRFRDFDLKTLINDFSKHYILVDEIPEGPWHYGNFACKIYKLIDQDLDPFISQ